MLGEAAMTGAHTGFDLSHLHPQIRTIALADDATRFRAIRSKRWITHPPAQRVLETLRDVFDQPAGDRMENVLLLAESGMGKTMLLRKFQREHAQAFDAVTGIRPYPVVFALMPEEPTEEAFFLQILKAVEAPFDLSGRRHRLSLRETTFRILREVGTRMLMVDEINSVLVGSARQQRQFLQLLRFLSNELQVAIVCAGVPEARWERKLSGLSGRQKVVRFRVQPAIQHSCTDDGDPMSALRGPSHPLLLGHASVGDLIHAALSPRG